jgi:hypothetical protein
MTACGRAGGLLWWLCRPSLGRAILCGGTAIYLGTFIGADPVTMFCAAQGVRLLIPALTRQSVRVEPALPRSRRRDHTRFDAEPDTDAAFAIADRYQGANPPAVSVAVPEPELTLDELMPAIRDPTLAAKARVRRGGLDEHAERRRGGADHAR